VPEERERAAVEIAATTARAARLAMAKLAATRAEVEATAAVDAARAAAVELDALCGSRISSSVSADGGTNDELKLAREAAREQESCTPRGAVAAAQTGADAPVALRTGARVAAVPPTAATAQTGADAPAARSTEIAAFTGGAALPPQTGMTVIAGSRPLSGTSVPVLGGIPSPRPTTLSGPR
jgi:hypothetical protein